MASSTNINGFNIGGNNNSFDQRGHFYRAFLDGNVSGMAVKQNSTPNMTVLVEHGSALLNKNTISASIAEIKSDTSVTIDTANTSNPRIDSIVIYEDTSVTIPTVEANYWQDGAGGRFKIVSLPGTAAASPTALTDANIQSAIGAGKPFARLANITVAANSTTILNSNINNSVRTKLGVSLNSVNGGTTAGVLTTDASGNVTPQGVWQNYAAVWKTGTATMTVGNGTFVSRYSQVNKTVTVSIYLLLGSTTLFNGTGFFTISLPVQAASAGGWVGSARSLDQGVQRYVGVASIYASGSIINIYGNNAPDWSNNAPFDWGAGDDLCITITYEAA